MSEEEIEKKAEARAKRASDQMAMQQKILDKLRFKMGDEVECNTAEGWLTKKLTKI